jgi:hypothetical protein
MYISSGEGKCPSSKSSVAHCSADLFLFLESLLNIRVIKCSDGIVDFH